MNNTPNRKSPPPRAARRPKKKKLNPLFVILLLALFAVVFTGLFVYFSVGYRYITCDNNTKFLGIVKDNTPSSGTVYYTDGTKSKLALDENTITYENGDKYVGEIKTLMRHGKGVMTFADGNVYDGDFFNDQMTGTGVFTYKNGDKYEGEFLNGERHGNGTYTWTDETGVSSYTGGFKNNMKDGEGT